MMSSHEAARTVEKPQDLEDVLRNVTVKIEREFEQQRKYDNTSLAVLMDQMVAVQTKCEELEIELRKHHPIPIGEEQAKRKILELMKKRVESGKTSITVLDILKEANLPFEQISRIVDALEKENKLIS